MDALGAIVTTCAQSLCPGCECIIAGSYRRGAKDSGDIDLLIFPPPVEYQSHGAVTVVSSRSQAAGYLVLGELIERLSQSGFLTDHLALPGNVADPTTLTAQHATYMGVCLLPGDHSPKTHRRIDIKVFHFLASLKRFHVTRNRRRIRVANRRLRYFTLQETIISIGTL